MPNNKVLFFTLGSELVASSRTRVFQYLPHLSKTGTSARVVKMAPSWDYWVIANFPERNRLLTVTKKGLTLFCLIVNKFWYYYALARLGLCCRFYDILFFQKVSLPISLVQWLKNNFKGKIFYDFDDAIYESSKVDRFLTAFLPITAGVFVENEETARYVQEKGAEPHIITGPIDCDRYQPAGQKNSASQNRKVVIGWIGSTSTTKYLEPLVDIFRKLALESLNFEVLLVGSNPSFAPTGFPLRRINWSLQTEVRNLSGMDVGIMPLSDDQWSRGKGGYKILQYMAMGLPCVASPVGVNSTLVADGATGFLPASQEQWMEYLRQLITDHDLRSRLGAEARVIATKKYSFQKYAPDMVSIFNGLKNSAIL